ncbi:glyoxalase bleomycin resistance protein dioxygenase [Colletotrichum musicola]|uniref:Glyoxalase bleomycin resistance protein dioxygenase n=1 Tax=Colletotrichum musicola TaxID=2175873 RepID=A0A8H6NF50_9PEZI|nr:glyoxalase bleomycin resistance protein dioxygenase [Colletotrichum musicola]
MGITRSFFYEWKNGLQGHPDIYGYGRDSHVGFAAKSKEEVDAAYNAALEEGGRPDEVFGSAPEYRKHYDDRYYAANILDADGNEIEITYKSFQHPSSGTD